MTMQTESAAGNFRLSMLISDTRYRSYTFQLVAMILLFASVGYLISNLIFNLQTAGLSISYEFLEEPAGYDINQRLIEYNSQSTHWRASVVGVLNTLLVAVVGFSADSDRIRGLGIGITTKRLCVGSAGVGLFTQCLGV